MKLREAYVGNWYSLKSGEMWQTEKWLRSPEATLFWVTKEKGTVCCSVHMLLEYSLKPTCKAAVFLLCLAIAFTGYLHLQYIEFHQQQQIYCTAIQYCSGNVERCGIYRFSWQDCIFPPLRVIYVCHTFSQHIDLFCLVLFFNPAIVYICFMFACFHVCVHSDSPLLSYIFQTAFQQWKFCIYQKTNYSLYSKCQS